MLRLDHCVIHVNADPPQLNALQRQIAPLGFPFDPAAGKGTGGFKVADVFVGQQYWELVWLKRADGGGWRPEWVARYNQGHRGLICLVLMTDQLDAQVAAWRRQGLQPTAPERITYTLLGFLKKTLPWRNAYLGPIPGTDLYLGLQEMDSPAAQRQMEQYAVPNAKANGITGFRRIIVHHPFTVDACNFLQAAFPQATGDERRLQLPLDDSQEVHFARGTANPAPSVEVQALATRPHYVGKTFTFMNVTMRTTEA
jgi:hypothetical protein